jgi:hypothetical protein
MCRSIDSLEPYSSRPGKRSEASDGLEPETVSGGNPAAARNFNLRLFGAGSLPNLSAVVRMTKKEGAGGLSRVFSAGKTQSNALPHKVLIWGAHGEKHPPCRVGAAERALDV